MNNNMVQEQNQVRVETKVKKIYLVDNKNDINYRIASLYNYIISKYSDFIEINQIIQNEEEQY